jgi:hypothetical protein
MQVTSKEALINLLYDIALSQVGVLESPLGSNTGPQVRLFQAATPLGRSSNPRERTGWPWCSAFTSWVMCRLWAMAFEEGNQVPLPFLCSSSCDALLEWAQEKGILFKEPQRGDHFLSMNPKNRHDATHTGLVFGTFRDTDGDLRLHTIEGNTNQGHSREGYGVFEFNGEKARTDHSQYRYFRPFDLLPASLFQPAPRLIVAGPPYARENYVEVKGARLENGSWLAPPEMLQSALRLTDHARPEPALPAGIMASVRQYLDLRGNTIDETKTLLGNHTADRLDPRQYVFVR